MKKLILTLAIPFILSACSAGSDTANKTSYSSPSAKNGSTSSEITNASDKARWSGKGLRTN